MRWPSARRAAAAVAVVAAAAIVLSGCSPRPAAGGTRKAIVVTYSALGALVSDLVGDAFTVSVEIPNGLDPHEWEPSAKDIEALNKASLVVENGLGLEAGMQKTLAAAREAGVPFFTASDSLAGQAGASAASGSAPDPHFWLDPVSMKSVIDALAERLKERFGVDLSRRGADLDARLDGLDAEIRAMAATVPTGSRRLVTGHESLAWFARRYGFSVVGAIVEGFSTQAEASAGQLASLRRELEAHPVKAVFTELGTPRPVADALARELHVKTVELGTHALPPDGSYFTLMRDLARTVCDNLR